MIEYLVLLDSVYVNVICWHVWVRSDRQLRWRLVRHSSGSQKRRRRY